MNRVSSVLGKGQIFLADFTSSVVIFSVFLAAFGVLWNSSVGVFGPNENFKLKQADYTFNLLRTEGNPSDWNSSTVRVAGLYSDVYLDEEKFLEFKDLSMPRKRELLRSQEFILQANYLNDTSVVHNGENLSTSSSDIPSSKTVFVRKDFVVLEEQGKRAELSFTSWES